jgi:protein-L-isoaspartate(D-aspartate) O-methyltransferase
MSAQAPSWNSARMVLQLRQAGLLDPRLMEAVERTPRDPFVPGLFQDSAWDNIELPIDCGQSMTRPLQVAEMVSLLEAAREHRVLEIGTGSGYATAIFARLCGEVATLDRYRTLTERARGVLHQLGIGHVDARTADGLEGWPEDRVFDRIVLFGSVSELPSKLAAQLAPGGVALAPVDRADGQRLIRFRRRADGVMSGELLAPSGFMALTPGVAREL